MNIHLAKIWSWSREPFSLLKGYRHGAWWLYWAAGSGWLTSSILGWQKVLSSNFLGTTSFLMFLVIQKLKYNVFFVLMFRKMIGQGDLAIYSLVVKISCVFFQTIVSLCAFMPHQLQPTPVSLLSVVCFKKYETSKKVIIWNIIVSLSSWCLGKAASDKRLYKLMARLLRQATQ